MKYKADQEGVLALKTMSAAIFSSTEQILGLTTALSTCLDSHRGYLGPHESSLEAVVENIETTVKTSTGPINEISEMLNDIADGYQEIIDDNPFAGAGGN